MTDPQAPVGALPADLITPPGPYSIGSDQWNGLSKLIEECGEVVQIAGKIVGASGRREHFDGSNLYERLRDEMADLQAALWFVHAACGIEVSAYDDRVIEKQRLFQHWNAEQRRALLAALDTQEAAEGGRVGEA